MQEQENILNILKWLFNTSWYMLREIERRVNNKNKQWENSAPSDNKK